MASTYMRNFRIKEEADRDSKINQEISANSSEEYRLKGKFKTEIPYSIGLWPVVGICTGIGVLTAFTVGKIMIPAMAAVGFLIQGIISSHTNNSIRTYNHGIQATIDENNQRLERNCADIRSECDRKIAKEENRYKTLVGKARQDYGGSVVLTPIINWLMATFDTLIRSADRGIYLPVIEASMYFEVYETEIAILARNPHSGALTVQGTPFSLKRNGQVHYKDVPDFFDRVGFAQALAKQLQFEVLKRYPKDPVAPMQGAVPKAVIEYDDSRMQIIYRAQNPRYQAPVNLKRGYQGS